MPTRVGHTKADSTDVYIGRGPGGRDMTDTEIGERGWLGNPHRVGTGEHEDARAVAVTEFRKTFEQRLVDDAEFRAAVAELSGKTLGCWCQRLDRHVPVCHGIVIAEWADKLAAGGDPPDPAEIPTTHGE